MGSSFPSINPADIHVAPDGAVVFSDDHLATAATAPPTSNLLSQNGGVCSNGGCEGSTNNSCSNGSCGGATNFSC